MDTEERERKEWPHEPASWRRLLWRSYSGGQVTLEEVAPEEVTLEEVTLEEVSPEEITLEEVALEEVAAVLQNKELSTSRRFQTYTV